MEQIQFVSLVETSLEELLKVKTRKFLNVSKTLLPIVFLTRIQEMNASKFDVNFITCIQLYPYIFSFFLGNADTRNV